MINNVFIWGSKSYALLVDDLISNYKTSLNLSLLNSNKQKLKSKFIFDPYSKSKNRTNFKGSFFSEIKRFRNNIKNCNSFVVCIGNNNGKARYSVSKFLERFSLTPINLISRYSLILKKTKIGVGVVAMPFSYVNSFSTIGDYTILNSNSNIEHECVIGKGCHIMSGACIAGRNVIGNFVTIGSNSTILPDISIGDGAYIGAGAVVTKNVKRNSIIVGNPGKHVKINKHLYDDKILKKILAFKK